VAEESGDLTLATTVALPVVRGPVQLAKTLAALDVLSDGRLAAGVGPGSSARDYAAAGIPFEERWPRFDEALGTLRALLRRGEPTFAGRFYSSAGIALEPPPVQRPGPPLWVASWGSPAGLRRTARYGDGWLASAYNTTPTRFGQALDRLGQLREAAGAAAPFPNAVATAWLCVTEDTRQADRVLRDLLAPMLGRPVEALRELALPIGPAEVCAERLASFARAGAQRVFVWPLRDELRQLERVREAAAPLLERGEHLM
jgi:alkanesulfonate monooxygenase SsuD/methylene tetrahydromethanopterin reductase-like flavin-dependent oxidoreductase (luciferase family)